MNTEVKNALNKALNQQTLAVRLGINDHPWKEKIEKISKRHRLSKDQTSSLTIEVAMILASIENPSIFIYNLMEELKINQKTAENIAGDCYSDIFEPIKRNIDSYRDTDMSYELEDYYNEVKKIQFDNNTYEKPTQAINIPINKVTNNPLKNKLKKPVTTSTVTTKNQPKKLFYEKNKDPYREPLS